MLEDPKDRMEELARLKRMTINGGVSKIAYGLAQGQAKVVSADDYIADGCVVNTVEAGKSLSPADLKEMTEIAKRLILDMAEKDVFDSPKTFVKRDAMPLFTYYNESSKKVEGIAIEMPGDDKGPKKKAVEVAIEDARKEGYGDW